MNRYETLLNYCNNHAITLTALRKQVLELVCQSDKPLGAYELLRTLQKIKPNAAPPTVYRALAFLCEQHLIHRLDSNNTYTTCVHPTSAHHNQFFLCLGCGLALEIEDDPIADAIATRAKSYDFQLANLPTEIRGYCHQCHHGTN